jgi:hypothetical protein
MLKDAKQKDARIIANPRTKGLTISVPINPPIVSGTKEKVTPKRKEERASPRKIAPTEMRDEISRSKVFAIASHGTIAGPIEVAVKKVVIPSNPVMSASVGTFVQCRRIGKERMV